MAAQTALRYARVADLLERQIESGALKPNERVPSLRAMSRHTGVSIGTVVQAYLHLERRGLLETRPRCGFFVTPRAESVAAPKTPGRRTRAPRAVAPKVVDTVIAALGRTELVALNSAVTDPAARLNGRLNSLTRRILREHPELPNVFLTPPGHDGLRREIAKRAALAGLHAEPDDVVITNGTMEALALALGTLCRPGDAVLVESPTYFGILQLLEHMKLKAVEVANRPGQGIDPDAFDFALAGAPIRAALLQSSFNNPTGAATPDAVKAHIVRRLAARRVPLIEDDIYGELHFGHQRPRPFAAFAPAGNAITCGSISKSVSLGFRVGWAIAPRHAAQLARAKFCTSVATATLQQHVLARYFEAGMHDSHLRRVRETLQTQLARFTALITEHFPAGTRISNPDGGVVLWLELPKGTDGLKLFRAALAERIGIAPGLIFSATGEYRNFVRLSAGVRLTPDVERAIAVLGGLAGRR